MKIIGLTGNIGSGKSRIARLFEKNHCKVIDLDKLGHEVLNQRECKKKLKQQFGDKICRSEAVCRPVLRKMVFSDERLLSRFNHIVHPALIRRLKGEIKRNRTRNYKALVIDAALIFELGLEDLMDYIITVDTCRLISFLRQRKMSFADFNRIYSSQMPVREKKARSDLVLFNNLPLGLAEKSLENKVKAVLNELA